MFSSVLKGAFDVASLLVDSTKEAANTVATLAESAAAVTAQPITIGTRNVVLTRLLAEGGFGFVHEARDANTGEPYAVKRMIAQDPDSAALAEAEVALLRRLDHPNIMALYDATTRPTERGTEHLLLLEFCPGGTLISHCLPLPSGELPPPLTLKRVVASFVDTCRGVGYLHSQSPPIQHRDLKLENVLVDARGRCKLCDFGSATTRVVDCATAERRERIDEEDRIARFTTAMNRAPEMLDLYRGHRIDHAVDVWALGCLLFTLAFQKHPFDTESPLQILNNRWAIPSTAPSYAARLEPIIKMMLEPDPAKRADVFAVCAAVEALEGGGGGGGATRRPVRLPEREARAQQPAAASAAGWAADFGGPPAAAPPQQQDSMRSSGSVVDDLLGLGDDFAAASLASAPSAAAAGFGAFAPSPAAPAADPFAAFTSGAPPASSDPFAGYAAAPAATPALATDPFAAFAAAPPARVPAASASAVDPFAAFGAAPPAAAPAPAAADPFASLM